MSVGSSSGIGFIDRFKTGWTLTRDSFGVIRDHPKLLVFPALAAVFSTMFFVVFFAPYVLLGFFGLGLEYLILFVWYFFTTFASTYFSAALVYGANKAFHGEDPGIVECMKAVSDRLGPIIVWSLIAATVSVFLKMLENSDNPVASILRTVVGAAWAIMTFFIVPVIVFEEVTVKTMFTESFNTFRETWGETLGAGFGITAILVLMGVVMVGLALLVSIPVGLIFPAGGIALTIILVLGAIIFTYLVGQAVWAIAKTALYMYAKEGETPEQFSDFDFETLGGRAEKSASPGSSEGGSAQPADD